MASQMRPPGGYPGAMGPPPMMPPPADPMESEAPRLWESQGPPRTTPLVDPAGPLPSDIFQSAAAVPTQLYSSGTFPAAGFQSAASMAPPASPDGRPSLWKSSRGDGAEGAGVMQSAPAPAVSPAPGTFANPFATAGPSAQVGYSPGLSTSPFDQGPIPLATPPAKAGPVADAVGRGDVTLRVSRLLDLPKNSAAAGKYYVEVSTKDGQSAKIGPLEADHTDGMTEDVETSSGDLTVTTGSQEILVKVLRKGMLSNTLIGESSIHRLDPRSRGKCAYALSSKDMPHPGGIELVVLERPPGKSAATHEPECLLPSQHNVLAILDVEKLVMLPPVSGMSMRDQVEIRIEPLEKNVNPGTKKDLTFVLGPYPTRNDPTKAALRMVEVKDREGTHGVRREYKGMFRADRGGLMRLRISAWYQAVFGAGEEIGSIDVDVTFAAVPVNLQHMTKKGKEAGKAGSIYVGYKLVEEKTWREQEAARSGVGAGNLHGSEQTEFDPQTMHSSAPAVGGRARAARAEVPFPGPAVETETEQIKQLEATLRQLTIENEQTNAAIANVKHGGNTGSKFDEAMKALGPPHLDPDCPLAPGLTASLYPVKVPVPKEQHVDASGRVLRTLETDGDQSTLETDGSEARGLLQSTSIYDEPPTDTYTMMLAPTPMVDPASLPNVSLRFQDVHPQYAVIDDVWGLAQKKPPTASHASRPKGPKGHPHNYRHPKVREDCILT